MSVNVYLWPVKVIYKSWSMEKTQQKLAIMFADVTGSTHIYERLGDTVASQVIGEVLESVSGIVQRHSGSIVKTIGDEVMCRFDKAGAAIHCACVIHEAMEKYPTQHGIRITFRIGIHFGAALVQDDGDIFGDAVNMAARMAGISKSRQIITSGDTLQQLTGSALIDQCRQIDQSQVKGKEKPVSIIEVMWEPNEATHMSTLISPASLLDQELALNLVFKQHHYTLQHGVASYSFGRDPQCDQVINSSLVSRFHAKIESRRGKFILVDESTNGTYLKMDDQRPVFLKREGITLHGQGVISFGEEPSESSDNLLRYSFD